MRDLTNELTVFVVSSGDNPNFPHCLEYLKKQSVKFKLDIIKDYYPMSRAFQEMLDRCNTPFYIQCDEDMMMYPDTVEKMFDSMQNTQSIMNCFKLHDAHLDILIYGIKIYRTDIFKKYPYNLENPSCEVEQLDRLIKDGYKYELSEKIMGEHSPYWSDDMIFERYSNLMQKFRLFQYVWLEGVPEKLFKIFAQNPTRNNFYAIAGMLSGIYEDNIMETEKDYRIRNKNLSRLKSFMIKPTHATVYVGSKCNFKCDFCPTTDKSISIEQFEDTKPEVVDTLLHKYPSIGGVCICGYAEPLIAKHVIDIIKTIKAHKKYAGLITNGSMLKYRLPELLEAKLDSISISLNAATQEEHEAISHTKTWKTVLEGIKASVESGLKTQVSAVVSTENIHRVPDIIKLVHSLGVKYLHLHNILPSCSGKFSDDDFWKLALTSQHKGIIDEWKKIPESCIVEIYPKLMDKNNGGGACDFVWSSIAVNGNGSISICNSVLPCDKKHGNIKDYVVLNNKQCTRFRDKYSQQASDLPCHKCFRNVR